MKVVSTRCDRQRRRKGVSMPRVRRSTGSFNEKGRPGHTVAKPGRRLPRSRLEYLGHPHEPVEPAGMFLQPGAIPRRSLIARSRAISSPRRPASSTSRPKSSNRRARDGWHGGHPPRNRSHRGSRDGREQPPGCYCAPSGWSSRSGEWEQVEYVEAHAGDGGHAQQRDRVIGLVKGSSELIAGDYVHLLRKRRRS